MNLKDKLILVLYNASHSSPCNVHSQIHKEGNQVGRERERERRSEGDKRQAKARATG